MCILEYEIAMEHIVPSYGDDDRHDDFGHHQGVCSRKIGQCAYLEGQWFHVLSVKFKVRYAAAQCNGTSCAYYIQFVAVNQDKNAASKKGQTADEAVFLCYTFLGQQ